MEKAESRQFHDLIHPLTQRKFWSEIFEKKDHFIESKLPKIEFDLLRFENLLWAYEDVLDKRVQVNFKGENIELHRKTSGKDWFRWCLEKYNEGGTIIFNGIDEIDPEAARFARGIDPVFKGRTTINAFLTPANSHGFLPHFDTHDVFILQTDGEKNWDLYKTELELPIDPQIYLIDQEKIGEPQVSYCLNPNNVLYIPRGKVHGSYTTSSYSLHLTIGVRPPLISDYYKTLIDIVTEQSVEFRKSIVNQANVFDSKKRVELIDMLKMLDKDETTNKTIKDRLSIKQASAIRPLAGFHLNGLHEAKGIMNNTQVEKAVGSFAVTEDGETISLYYPGAGLTADRDILPGYFSLPAVAKQAVEFILTSEHAFTPDDLPQRYPEETRLLIVRRLVEEGFLMISKRSSI